MYKEIGQTATMAKGVGNSLKAHLLYVGRIIDKLQAQPSMPAEEAKVLVAEIQMAEDKNNKTHGITAYISKEWDFEFNRRIQVMDC